MFQYNWRMMLSASDPARKFLQPRIVPHAKGEDHRERRSDQVRQQLDGVCSMYSRYFNTISSMQPSVIFPYITRLGHVKMMFKCSKDIQLGAKLAGMNWKRGRRCANVSLSGWDIFSTPRFTELRCHYSVRESSFPFSNSTALRCHF